MSSEPDSFHSETKLRDVVGAAHGGQGDINILMPDLGRLFAAIKQMIPLDQASAVERLIGALRQLKDYQKHVSELKSIHNMLHRLEIALTTVEVPIKNAVRHSEALSFYNIEDEWQISIKPQIWTMRRFASTEMAFLGPRFQSIENKMTGPEWLLDLITLQIEFETSLRERSTTVIYDSIKRILDKCREHLFDIDQQLLDAANKLEQFSDEILKGLTDG